MASTTKLMCIVFALLYSTGVEAFRRKRSNTVSKDSGSLGYRTAWPDGVDNAADEAVDHAAADDKADDPHGEGTLEDSTEASGLIEWRPKFKRPKFKNPISGIKNKVSKAKDKVASKVNEAKDKVASTVSDHAEKLSSVKDKFNEAKDKLDIKDKFNEAKDKLASKVSDHAEKLSSTIKDHASKVSKAVSEKAKPLLAMGADAFLKCGAGAAMGNPAAVMSCIKTQAADLKAQALEVGDDVHDVVKSSYGTFTKGLAEDAATEISTMISLQNEFESKVAEGQMTFKDALDGVVQKSVEDVIKENMEIATQVKEIRTEIDTLADEEIKR